jgi:UrcA family protein
MTLDLSTLLPRGLVACATAALAIAAASPAPAQPASDRYDDEAGVTTTLGGVTVIAPRRAERDSATGAPIETVLASRVVRYDDLDLSRPWGMRALHARVERAARSACDELDSRYPITASDSPPCVRTAVRQAMYRVEADNSYDYED